jgi:protein TonB
MFNELLESVVVKKRTHKGWGVFASLLFQTAGLAILILIPLVRTQALPKAIVDTFLVAPVPRAPAPPPPAAVPRGPRGVRLAHGNRVYEPIAIPIHAQKFVETVLPPDQAVNADASGNDAVDELLGVMRNERATAVPNAASVVPSRVRVGGAVEAAKIIEQPQPVYPVVCVQGRIQGTVILHAVIGQDGRVVELEAISGHPLLALAALDAVRRWRYSPTLLNSTPVEVETTITVNFVLDR